MLIIRNRYLYRVVYPQYLIAIIYFIYQIGYNQINQAKSKFKNQNIIISIIICISFLGMYLCKYNKIAKENDSNYQICNEIISQIANDGNLYLVESSMYNELTMNYIVDSRKEIGEYKNILKLGGGDCFSQRYYDYIERFNLEYSDNLYKNLTNSRVYYIGNINDILNLYMQQNISKNGKFSKYKKINNITIYSYNIEE